MIQRQFVAVYMVMITLTVVSTSTVCWSQIAGGLSETTRTEAGGRHFISGNVVLPTGGPAGDRTRIRLSGQSVGESSVVGRNVTSTASVTVDVVATTDSEGKFVFSGLSNGTYTVTFEGDSDYELTSQQVDISVPVTTGRQNHFVTLRLRAKRKIPEKPEIINIDNFGVTKKALELHKVALELSKVGDHKGAIEQLKLAVAQDPSFMLGFTELGVQYAKLNEFEKADEALQAALKLKPDAFEPLINRGIVLFRLKRTAESETHLRAALKVKDQSAVAHFYLGRTLIASKKYDEAETELNTAISIGGDDVKEAHRILAMMYLEKEDYKRALPALEAYLQLVPDPPDGAKLRDVVKQLRSMGSDPQKP